MLTGSSLRGYNTFVVLLCLTYILPAVALVPRNPYSKIVARQTSDPLEVDVGYATYRGYHNDTTGLNTWLGYGDHIYKLLYVLLIFVPCV